MYIYNCIHICRAACNVKIPPANNYVEKCTNFGKLARKALHTRVCEKRSTCLYGLAKGFMTSDTSRVYPITILRLISQQLFRK